MNQWAQSFRILLKHRFHTAITVIGLGVAVSSVWFIANYVTNANQYDLFHQHHDRIYRLSMEIGTSGSTDHYATTGLPIGDLLTRDYTGFDAYASLTAFEGVVRLGENLFREKGFFEVNPDAMKVFSFQFVEGGASSDPTSVIISKSLSLKYFNTASSVGKPLEINERQYVVGGVFEDWPINSHLNVQALVFPARPASYELQDWFNLDQYTYVLLNPNLSQIDLDERLSDLTVQYLEPDLEGSGFTVKFYSQPLSKLYFSPGLIDDVAKGNANYLQTLVFAGILLLMIGSVNYVNLILTRSHQRRKEIALKKMLGISTRQFLMQTALESGMMTVMIFLVSVLLVLGLDGFYFHMTGFSVLHTTVGWFPLLLFMFVFLVGLLGSGLSSIRSTVHVLPKQERATVRLVKKVLLGAQFAVAMVMLMVTSTIDKQVDFMRSKDLGFTKEQVLILHLPESNEQGSHHVALRDELNDVAATNVVSLIGGGALPGEENGKDVFQIEGIESDKIYNIYRIDENYFPLLAIEFAKGRNFDAGRKSDQEGSVIINEALAKSLGWTQPLGKKITYGDEEKEVIGVVKNFHNKSLHNPIEPIVFLYDTRYALSILLRTSTENAGLIHSIWSRFYPDVPVAITYFDHFIDAMYHQENQMARLSGFFSMISLILCSIGLFSLFSLHVQQKTKELSVRKVLGANMQHLFGNVTGGFAGITAMAIVVAAPFGFIVSDQWISSFSFRTSLGFWVFMVPLIMLFFASTMAVAYHLVYVARVNPVVTLKEE